ncbi:MAG: serine/threonine protein kinase [Polyangiaceae bacterium]|nr:serine/threonine protein kinase [Polyangiaceae bacterium]
MLEALLGAGTIGRVFRARHVDGSVAALKVLHPHLVENEDARARFLREARALSNVQHRSIGRIIGAFEESGSSFLALELYEGVSLRGVLDARFKLSPQAAIPLLRELVEALGALHEAGWIHRDLKPENVMVLDPDAAAPRNVRLLDFGLARPMVFATGDVRTAAGMFVGSLAYAAPEQILGDAITPATDWWSLGIVAFEMLAGHRPFQGSSRPAMARNLLREAPPALDVDRKLALWVEALLAKDAHQRPASFRDVLAGLNAAV